MISDFKFQFEYDGNTHVAEPGWFPLNDMDEVFDLVETISDVEVVGDDDFEALVVTGFSPILWAGILITDAASELIGDTGGDHVPVNVATFDRDGQPLYRNTLNVLVEAQGDDEYVVGLAGDTGATRAMIDAKDDGSDTLDELLSQSFPKYLHQRTVWDRMDQRQVRSFVDITGQLQIGLAQVVHNQR